LFDLDFTADDANRWCSAKCIGTLRRHGGIDIIIFINAKALLLRYKLQSTSSAAGGHEEKMAYKKDI